MTWALIDALLDAGADIEHEGSSINGGVPLSSAVGYGQWAAARWLVERVVRALATLLCRASLAIILAKLAYVRPQLERCEAFVRVENIGLDVIQDFRFPLQLGHSPREGHPI